MTHRHIVNLLILTAVLLWASPAKADEGDSPPADVPSQWLIDLNWGAANLFPNPAVTGGQENVYVMPGFGAELRLQFARYQQLGIRTDWMRLEDAPGGAGEYRDLQVAAVYGGVLPVDRFRLTADIGLGWSWVRHRRSIHVIAIGSGPAMFGSIGATYKLHRNVGLGIDALGSAFGNPTLRAYGSVEFSFGTSERTER